VTKHMAHASYPLSFMINIAISFLRPTSSSYLFTANECPKKRGSEITIKFPKTQKNHPPYVMIFFLFYLRAVKIFIVLFPGHSNLDGIFVYCSSSKKESRTTHGWSPWENMISGSLGLLLSAGDEIGEVVVGACLGFLAAEKGGEGLKSLLKWHGQTNWQNTVQNTAQNTAKVGNYW
jgi:hypothetical protein